MIDKKYILKSVSSILDKLSLAFLNKAIDEPIEVLFQNWSIESVPSTGSALVFELARFRDQLSNAWLNTDMPDRKDEVTKRHPVLTTLDRKGDHIDIIIDALSEGAEGVRRVMGMLSDYEKVYATEHYVIRAFPFGQDNQLSQEETTLLAQEYLHRFRPLVPETYLPDEFDRLVNSTTIIQQHIDLAQKLRELNGGCLIPHVRP